MKRHKRTYSWIAICFLTVSLVGCQFLSRYSPFSSPKHDRHSRYSGWDSLAGGISPLRACYDVQYYDLSVIVEPEIKSISGVSTMYFHAETAFDRMQVDLHHKLAIDSLTINDKSAPFTRKRDIVYIITPPFHDGNEGKLTIHYHGKPAVSRNPPWKGGFVWAKDPWGAPWVGAVCENQGASLWWPNKAHPSDEPDSMCITLHVPAGLQAISNGSLEETKVSLHDENFLSWKWKVANPINSDNVTMYIGRYDFALDTLRHGPQEQIMQYFVLPHNREKAKAHFAQMHKIFAFMEERFGPYPFWNDGFKIVEAPYVGMEHQSAIAYGNGFDNFQNYFTLGAFDYILLHETAHQWWGNSLTACDVAETWLHEGFATYSEVLYLEQYFGKLHAQAYLENLRGTIDNEYPLIGPRGVNYHSAQNSDVYAKGAWVLHSFRTALQDDDLFNQILKEWSISRRKSIVCTTDFVALVNEITGTDWWPFFNRYLYQASLPQLEFFQDSTHLFARWNDVKEGFQMPCRFIGKQFGQKRLITSRILKFPFPTHERIFPDQQSAYFEPVENPLLPALMDLE